MPEYGQSTVADACSDGSVTFAVRVRRYTGGESVADEEEQNNRLETVGWSFVVVGTLMSLIGSYLLRRAR